MTVKGLLVKFVGPTNKQDSRHLVKSGPAEESIECQRQGGLFPPLVTGARRSPLRFFFNFEPFYMRINGRFMCKGLDFSRFGH